MPLCTCTPFADALCADTTPETKKMPTTLSTYDGSAEYDSGIEYADEDGGIIIGGNVYNIKLPMTDADETAWQTALVSLGALVDPFKPQATGATHKSHIAPEDMETIELVLGYAIAHSAEMAGTTDVPAFDQIIDLAKRTSGFEKSVQEQVIVVHGIAQFARDYAYETARKIIRVNPVKQRFQR